MIIAILNEQRVCHTVLDVGVGEWEMKDNHVLIDSYDMKYIKSYHDGSEWLINPNPQEYAWDSETLDYVSYEDSVDDDDSLDEETEETIQFTKSELESIIESAVKKAMGNE